jgi:hypothetical protein
MGHDNDICPVQHSNMQIDPDNLSTEGRSVGDGLDMP